MTISAPVVEAAKAVGAREAIPGSRLLDFVEVETGGREVEALDGRTPTHLPEPKWFWKRLPPEKRAAAVAAGLAQEHGDVDYNAFAATSADRCARFAAMVAVDEAAAYESCSWGLPQIMGFNAESLGYESARAMVEAWMAGGVQEQIEAMVHLWDHMGIRSAVVAGQWEAAAERYNGPLWRENDYAAKLARADATWHARLGTGQVDFSADQSMLQIGDKGPAVESLQRVLLAKHYAVKVDGGFGATTEIQVVGFQKQHGLVADGKVGPDTRRALIEATPRPLGARALATMRSVARTTVIGAKARLAKVGAIGLGGLQVAKGASGDGHGPGLMEHVQNAVDAGAKAKTLWGQVTDLASPLGQVPHGLASVAYATATSPSTLASVGACGGIWCLAHGIHRAQTEAVKDGTTIG